MDAAASPLPSEDTTPPVTKMYFTGRPSGRCVMPSHVSRAVTASSWRRTRSRSSGVSTPMESMSCLDCVDAIAVLERAQLFERLGALERRLRERGEFQRKVRR